MSEGNSSCTVQIRELTPRDAATLIQLRVQCIGHDPHSFCVLLDEERQISQAQVFSMLQRFQNNPRSMLWGAFYGDKMVGMIGLESLVGQVRQHRGIVSSLCVLPDFRHYGIGRALVEVLIGHSRSLESLRYLVLEVSAVSKEAITLYQSVGFQQNGVEVEALHYDDQFIDLYRMNLKL